MTPLRCGHLPAGWLRRRQIPIPGLLLLVAAALLACTPQAADHDDRSAWDAAPGVPITAPLVPAVITEPVPGDTDDPAIWIDPRFPERSLILGTDKHDTDGALYVFDLEGRIDRARSVTGLQRPNNVDAIGGVSLGGVEIEIAAVTERGRMMLRIFRLPGLEPIDGGGIPLFDGDLDRAPMGVALYRRPRDGVVFAIVGGKSGPAEGYLWQVRLFDAGDGTITGEHVRSFGAFSGWKEIEAIAVDPEHGYVYYSDETVGIRKYHADPDAGDAELATFGTAGFVEDHEGIAIYPRPDGSGFILVSDQQGGRLQLFPREGEPGEPHRHEAIAVIPVAALDADGIEVSRASLPGFEDGILVMMSADRTFHFYRWSDVEERIESARTTTIR